MKSAFLRYLPNTTLITHNNQQVSFHDLIHNRVVIISMFYATCVRKCVPLGNHMKKCIDFIGDDIIRDKQITFLHISLDAKYDTVQRLNDFRRRVGAVDREYWTFVTGNYEDIETLRFKLGMYERDPERDKIKSNHSGMALIMNERVHKKNHCKPFENVINMTQKIFSVCIPEVYSSSGYRLFKRIPFETFTTDFIDKIFTNIHTINQARTLPFLPDRFKYIFRTKAIEANRKGFHYDPYSEYIPDCPITTSCCCKEEPIKNSGGT